MATKDLAKDKLESFKKQADKRGVVRTITQVH